MIFKGFFNKQKKLKRENKMEQANQTEEDQSETNHEKDIILFVVTNKKGNGEKKDKGYYSSFLLPAGVYELVKNENKKVFVLDIDEPRNYDFYHGKKDAPLYAFPVDGEYKPELFDEYQANTQQISAQDVSFVVPYVSAEADPVLLTNMKLPFLDENGNLTVGMLNDSDGLLACDSKASLEETRNDPDAAHISQYFLPNVLIKTPEEYEKEKVKYENGVVLRVPCSTEGVGVFIKDEIEENGGIEQKLKDYPDGLLLTPYFDTHKTGDTRVYAFVDNDDNVTVIRQGIKRIAAPGKHSKCNVSAGGSFEIVELTEEQKQIAADAAVYYKKKHGLHWIGFDFFSIPEGTEPEKIGGKIYFHIISEGNFSPDGLNLVENGVSIVASNIVKMAEESGQERVPERPVATQQPMTRSTVVVAQPVRPFLEQKTEREEPKSVAPVYVIQQAAAARSEIGGAAGRQ